MEKIENVFTSVRFKDFVKSPFAFIFFMMFGYFIYSTYQKDTEIKELHERIEKQNDMLIKMNFDIKYSKEIRGDTIQ